jgi:cyclopropane fatty-acyl-phospholipid synthase-like methyltransferase
MSMPDRSNGYEGVAAEFLASRGSGRGVGIGVEQIRNWARALPPGATVLELGSGPGHPTTAALVSEGLNVYAIDASPTFVEAFRSRFPNTPIACEAVEDSTFFDRTFDGVIAWGLIFLLPVDAQRRLIQRVAKILTPGGRFLFTSDPEPLAHIDAMTGHENRSLGAEEYRELLRASGFTNIHEYQDEGENYYFDAVSL